MKMRNSTTFALLGVLFFAQASLAQKTAQSEKAKVQVIKAADLQVDWAVLRRAYEELHPGLYRYNTKAEMDAHFEELKRKLSHDLPLQDAYLAFSEFAAQVKCGHTYANFFNQTKEIAEELFQGQNRVPFYFVWMNGRMVITRDFTPDHQLPRGTQVVAINGNPADTILKRLMTIARADGSNDPKRVAYLEVTGDDKYEAFDIYFPMFFPQTSTTMQLVAQRPGERKPAKIAVQTLTYAERVEPRKSQEATLQGGDQPLFEWKYLDNGSAYLRMPSWALYKSKWDWKAWLNAKLDELADKNAPALIVDLRGNEGGNDVGDEILSRLVAQDLKIPAFGRLVRYRQTPEDLNPYLDTWDPSFKNWGTAAHDLDKPWPTAPPVHYFLLVRDGESADGDMIVHSAKPFRGKLFVLIDANNSSATFQFDQIVKQNKLGTLVGQPTGGNLRGINGGAFFFLRLPKSHIEMDIPLIARFPSSPQPDAGITPDIPVAKTIEDIISGADPEMAAVRAQLRK
jgi:C-terminal processing protease CtpA/Prc